MHDDGQPISQAHEAHRAEAHRAEAELERFFALSIDMLGIAGFDGYFTRLNAAWERTLGWSTEELLAKPWLDFVHPDDQKATLDAGATLTDGVKLISFVNRYLCKDGSYKWLLWNSMPIPETETIYGIARDVTEGMLAHRAMAHARADLEVRVQQQTSELTRETAEREAAEARFRLLVESVRDYAIIMIDPAGRIASWNAGAAQITGFAESEVLGTHVRGLFTPEDAALGKPDEELRTALLHGRVETDGWRARKDGSRFWADIVVTRLTSRTGELVGFAKITGDVTERRALAEQRQRASDTEQAKAHAEAANRAKSAFLAAMSHEIRTPMNAVLGFSALMLRDPSATPRQREHLEAISTAGDQLLSLLDQILEIAKIEANRIEIRPTTFAPGALLEDLERLFGPRAALKGLQVIAEWQGPTCYVVADEGRVRQILSNLIGNGIKFSESGGVALRGRLDAGARSSRLVIEVQDSGPGMSAEDAGRLFRKFEQAEAGRRSQTGTGLGLAISKELAVLLGGDVTVRTAPGDGSVFRVEIPVTEGAATDVREKRVARKAKHLRSGQPPVRVLVVDDKEHNRALLTALLQDAGFVTAHAVDGADGLRAFHAWHPDLVLMDMRMPTMDGAEAIARIRETEAGRRVKIISVSASAFEEDEHAARAIGADEFVRKPVRVLELLDKIGAVLGVDYEYEGDDSRAPARERAPTGHEMGALPEELRARLRAALRRADVEATLALVNEAEAHDGPTATRLRRLVERFAYDALFALLGPDPAAR
jgi:PAS domain S-box-containing protein